MDRLLLFVMMCWVCRQILLKAAGRFLDPPCSLDPCPFGFLQVISRHGPSAGKVNKKTYPGNQIKIRFPMFSEPRTEPSREAGRPSRLNTHQTPWHWDLIRVRWRRPASNLFRFPKASERLDVLYEHVVHRQRLMLFTETSQSAAFINIQ